MRSGTWHPGKAIFAGGYDPGVPIRPSVPAFVCTDDPLHWSWQQSDSDPGGGAVGKAQVFRRGTGYYEVIFPNLYPVYNNGVPVDGGNVQVTAFDWAKQENERLKHWCSVDHWSVDNAGAHSPRAAPVG